MTVRRVLVLRALGLGDILAGIPALRAIRRGLPDHEMVLAAPTPMVPLVRMAGAADHVLPTPDLGPVRWPYSSPPTLAVDLHGNGPASKAPLLELMPERLVAFAGPGPDGEPVAGPQWDPDEHEVVRWCRLVADGVGVPTDRHDLLLPLPADAAAARRAGHGPVVIHPGASYESRRWPVERFAAVAAWARRFAPVAVTGSADERDRAEEVRRRAGLPPSSVLAGHTDVVQLGRVVAGARLVVSGDTGIAHLASAYRTPSVVLFGPIPPALWGPPPEGPHVALWHGSGLERGDPHGGEPDPRLLEITVREVVAAAVSLLQGLPPNGQRSSSPRGRPRRTSGRSAPAPPREASSAPSRGARARG